MDVSVVKWTINSKRRHKVWERERKREKRKRGARYILYHPPAYINNELIFGHRATLFRRRPGRRRIDHLSVGNSRKALTHPCCPEGQSSQPSISAPRHHLRKVDSLPPSNVIDDDDDDTSQDTSRTFKSTRQQTNTGLVEPPPPWLPTGTTVAHTHKLLFIFHLKKKGAKKKSAIKRNKRRMAKVV